MSIIRGFQKSFEEMFILIDVISCSLPTKLCIHFQIFLHKLKGLNRLYYSIIYILALNYTPIKSVISVYRSHL